MTASINHNLESIKKHFKIKSMNLNFWPTFLLLLPLGIVKLFHSFFLINLSCIPVKLRNSVNVIDQNVKVEKIEKPWSFIYRNKIVFRRSIEVLTFETSLKFEVLNLIVSYNFQSQQKNIQFLEFSMETVCYCLRRAAHILGPKNLKV